MGVPASPWVDSSDILPRHTKHLSLITERLSGWRVVIALKELQFGETGGEGCCSIKCCGQRMDGERVPVERRSTGAELGGGGPFGSGLELLSKLPQA